jgi:hypothetical protein
MRITQFSVLLVLALACALFASPAHAQRARVFVASYGSDSNPCTFGSPCKTFQHAINTVAYGGEITAINSAGFGIANITQAVTIDAAPGVAAGIAASPSGAAILINAGVNDTVILRGLTLEGAGTAGTGIQFNSGARLEVIGCTIQNYLFAGLFIGAQSPTTALVANTIVTGVPNLAEGAIFLYTYTGGSLVAALDQVTVADSYNGIQSSVGGGPIEVVISNSHVDNNTNAGIIIAGTDAANASGLFIKNVTLAETPIGVELSGYATAWLSQVTQTNFTGIFPCVGGVFFNGGQGNAAYSDGSNFLCSVNGGVLGTWTPG